MSPWGWRPDRAQGIWRHGPLWFRPLSVLAPWASGALCLMLMYVVGDTLTVSKGVLFDLPDASSGEGEASALVAVVMPLKDETAVFFDDARYAIEDGASAAVLRDHLAERSGRLAKKTLLVLADRRIPCGDLMRLAEIAKASGLSKVLFANKRTEGAAE